MNQNIRKITDGAMMLAIVGAALLMDRQLAGLISSMALFLFPLPMVFYAAKYGLRSSGMVLGALFAMLFILGTPQSIFFVGAESIIGTVYGAGVHAGTDNRRILLRTLILGGIVELLAMVVFASFFGYDITAEINEYTDMLSQLTENSGIQFSDSILSESSLRNLLVISAILTGVLEGLVTHLVSRLMLKRLRFPLPKSTPIPEYYPARWTGYAAFIGLCLYYYSLMRPFSPEIYQTAVQAAGTLGLIYLIGFGMVAMMVLFAYRFPQTPRWAVVVLIMLAFMMVSLLLAITGFLYISTDMHERICKGGNNAAKD